MRLRRSAPIGASGVAAAAVALAAIVPGLAQAVSPPKPGVPAVVPLRDFFANPAQAFFRISDDGRWLSWMQPAVGEGGSTPRMNIFVQALEGSKPTASPKQMTRESARDINNYFWKGGSTLLYQKDFGGDENFHVVAVDVATGKVVDLTPHEGARAEIVDNLEDDPDHVLVQHNKRDKQAMDLYRVHVRTGAETLVASNPGNVLGWVTDHQGKVRMAVASDGVNNKILYRATEAEPFKTVIETDFRTEVQPLFFDFDNKQVFLLSNRGRDLKALVKWDPAQPEAEQVVWQHPKVDLAGATYSKLRKVLATVEYADDLPGRHVFDAKTASLMDTLKQRLPGYQIEVQAATRQEDKFIIAAYNDRTSGTRYLFDAKVGGLNKLAVLNPKLPEPAMAPMKPIRYKARDGLEIPGYLTLPVGRPAKNLACIVNPHGGPWARDMWGFNPEVQFLANRGYCVLQMNFRGSTGYGRKFWEASFGQWGLKMQDDVTDGAQWLIKQGIADPKRLGIYGGSYGGYATLAGITFTPDLYAAAVDYVGVANLFTFMKTIPPYWEPFRQQMYAMVGNPDDPKDNARLAATSPVLHADKIKTPLLVAQGAKDPRVNKAESDQMVEALKKRGVTVQYIVKDNEGHGFRNEENRFEFYEAMEAFFGKHLKP
ncbi:alpha/beta hydrolase family protein [Ideonella paludis]|uniref:S9 family peptidase n=1 Tax=Ideonella paludis TaxID=1233411 RepID=A0ABS5DTC0_9BURK|nr:S9 family peptidase [Ideonella paludis]MBQ0934350.1 S9 family peptidase [Ideonella paludis]